MLKTLLENVVAKKIILKLKINYASDFGDIGKNGSNKFVKVMGNH